MIPGSSKKHGSYWYSKRTTVKSAVSQKPSKPSMKTRFLLPAALVALTMTLAACKPAQTPEATPATEASTPAAPTAEASAPETVGPTAAAVNLSVDPAGLSTCDKSPHVVTVKWDASAVANVKRVEIWISKPGGELKLFARAARSGEKQTGNWARVGTQFVLKDLANGAELSRITIAGLPCP